MNYQDLTTTSFQLSRLFNSYPESQDAVDTRHLINLKVTCEFYALGGYTLGGCPMSRGGYPAKGANSESAWGYFVILTLGVQVYTPL